MAMVICGCTSTQTTAARLQLNDDRIRAAEVPVKVKGIGTSTSVTAESVTTLSEGGHLTVVVSLKNSAADATSDLPLILGYHAGARTVYLNAGVQSNYFNNHIPAIAGHGSLAWVDTTSVSKLPKGARPFALVGAKPASPVGSGWAMPKVTAETTQHSAGAAQTTTIDVHVKNESSISQYQLPVYAVVTRGSQILSASAASIATLNSGASAVVKVSVPGVTAGSFNLEIEAPPTIFK